jgi:hypothetical protein
MGHPKLYKKVLRFLLFRGRGWLCFFLKEQPDRLVLTAAALPTVTSQNQQKSPTVLVLTKLDSSGGRFKNM